MVVLVFLFSIFNFHEKDSGKFIINNSKIIFYSYAPIENIEAENIDAIGVVDFSTREFIIKIPMNKFDFPNNLMEKHFNDSYLETEKFPNCIFKGTLSKSIDIKKIGLNDVTAKGKLELHGVSNNLQIPLKINISEEKIDVISNFEITLGDYEIKIPKLLFKNIAEIVEVKVNTELKKYIVK